MKVKPETKKSTDKNENELIKHLSTEALRTARTGTGGKGTFSSPEPRSFFPAVRNAGQKERRSGRKNGRGAVSTILCNRILCIAYYCIAY